MKVTFKRTGDWQKIRTMFLRRNERMQAMRERMLRDLTEALAKQVRDAIPPGKEMEVYKKSIETREFSGNLPKDMSAYAIISNPEPMEVSDLDPKSYVIYVVPKGPVTDFFGQLLIQYSPWTKIRLPVNYMEAQGVQFVHRKVSEGEIERLRDLNDRVLKDNAKAFQKAQAKLPPKPEAEIKPPVSMPDIMFLALRMEFGIQERHVPHWGLAYKRRMETLRRLLGDNEKYAKYVMDPNYNGWVQTMKRWKKISPQRFSTQYDAFDKAIAK